MPVEPSIQVPGGLARPKRYRLIVAAGIGALIVAALLSINWYPVIMPDSLQYLAHSNDLIGTGLVQVGYRQFAYPVWIATTAGVGSALGAQPLHATVVAQFALLAVSVAACIAALRWWSAPVVVVLTLPTTIAYANFILTESVAIPLAVIAGSALVGMYTTSASSRTLTAWTTTAAVSATLLPTIRLHYGLITLAVVVGLLLRPGHTRVTKRLAAPTLMLVAVTFLVGGLTVENRIENGAASPSLGAERALFWILWHTVVVEHRDVVAQELADIYLDGSPYDLVLQVDNSGLPHPAQRAAYRDANTAILSITGESLTRQRIASAGGVFLGGRLDDLRPALLAVAGKDTTIPIHQYGSVRPVDEQWIADEYNDGIRPSAVFTSAGAIPTLRRPYLGVAIGSLTPAASILAVYLTIYRRSRGLALAGVITTVGYAVMSFVFLFDNLRFLVPELMFALVVIMGASLMRWQPPEAASPQSLPPATPTRTLS